MALIALLITVTAQLVIATMLMWLRTNSGAFEAGVNGDGHLNFANCTDWRLPDVK